MRSRERLLQIAVWDTLQNEVRKSMYSKVEKSLRKICNTQEKESIVLSLKGTDTDVIESILSNIAELLDI